MNSLLSAAKAVKRAQECPRVVRESIDLVDDPAKRDVALFWLDRMFSLDFDQVDIAGMLDDDADAEELTLCLYDGKEIYREVGITGTGISGWVWVHPKINIKLAIRRDLWGDLGRAWATALGMPADMPMNGRIDARGSDLRVSMRPMGVAA